MPIQQWTIPKTQRLNDRAWCGYRYRLLTRKECYYLFIGKNVSSKSTVKRFTKQPVNVLNNNDVRWWRQGVITGPYSDRPTLEGRAEKSFSRRTDRGGGRGRTEVAVTWWSDQWEVLIVWSAVNERCWVSERPVVESPTAPELSHHTRRASPHQQR